MSIEILEETLNQAELVYQQQLEDYARKAHRAKLAVWEFADALRVLVADYPDCVSPSPLQLAELIEYAADDACVWAKMNNADFDPAIPHANQ
jgi:hypothetical protein